MWTVCERKSGQTRDAKTQPALLTNTAVSTTCALSGSRGENETQGTTWIFDNLQRLALVLLSQVYRSVASTTNKLNISWTHRLSSCYSSYEVNTALILQYTRWHCSHSIMWSPEVIIRFHFVLFLGAVRDFRDKIQPSAVSLFSSGRPHKVLVITKSEWKADAIIRFGQSRGSC